MSCTSTSTSPAVPPTPIASGLRCWPSHAASTCARTMRRRRSLAAAEVGVPTRRILIDPVTRIEGHAKITIFVDDAGEVTDARFHVTEFRGFETFCQGRPLWEMPGLCARVCGICPVSHLLASAKAGDMLLGVAIPPAADRH